MRMCMNVEKWIERCEETETYVYMEALCDLKDESCKKWCSEYSSDEIAEYIIKHEGGLASLYQAKNLFELCYDITFCTLYS